ncbi:MAG: WD40 repeat domain-containing protein [Candidatus Sericytochromatia bacterium]
MDELRIITKKIIKENNKSLSEYKEKSLIDNNNLYKPKKYELFPFKEIKAHASDILSGILFKNYIITGSSDKTICLWDSENFDLINTLNGHSGAVYSLAIWNNYLVSSSTDKTIRIWDIENFKLLTTILAHQNQIYSIYCKDNILISSSLDKTIKVWDILNKKLLGVINIDSSAWAILIYNNRIFAGLSDGSLRIYDINTLSLLSLYKEHSEAITQIKIFDNKIYTSSKDKTLKVWNIETFDLENTIEDKQVIWSFLLDKNKCIIGGDDKTLRLFDLNDKKNTQTINAHTDWISQIISINEKIISFSGDSKFKVWFKKPIYNCENIDFDIKSIDKSPFETEDEFNNRKIDVYLDLANKIIDYDYISIGTAKLISSDYNFDTRILPIIVDIKCDKIIKLSKLDKNFKSYIIIEKKDAQNLSELNNIINVYIKYYSEKNNIRYELCILDFNKKYLISPNYIRAESNNIKKVEVKKDRLDIKINKPNFYNDKALYIPEHDCNSIILSDTFRKAFEDYNEFEKRVKDKLLNYKYINCGKIELLADKYSINDKKFPIKSIFTCDKLLNIISLLPENNNHLINSESKSNQVMSLNKYEFYSFIIIDRYEAKNLYENSRTQNLYLSFIENLDKLYFELFIIFNGQRYFIM